MGTDKEDVGVNCITALAEAINMHRAGHLDQARPVYQQVLEASPENSDALHFLGLICHQMGEAETAVDHIRKALRHAPGYVEAWNNLGTICQSLGQFDEAEACYRKVIHLSPEHADSHNNLGVVLKAQGRLHEAAMSYRQALALNANHAQAHHNLGNLLRRDGQAAEAIAHFRSAIDANLGHSEAEHALVNTLLHQGHLVAAHEALNEWLERAPDHPIALHIQASLQDGPVPSRASDDYVRMMFDRMAATFDEHLDDLGYRAHTLVVQALHKALGPRARNLTILDAGCGTGLCGPLVRPIASQLVGIDLSSGMLQRAKLTTVYDELIEAELTAFLQPITHTYDAIVCADTLCYFGDLTAVTAAAMAALRPGGWFIFTLEYWPDESATGYFLNPHGRYGHGRDYLGKVIGRSGLILEELTVVDLRREIGKPVAGLLVTSRKPLTC